MTTLSHTRKIALVTGGNKGIGFAVVRQLALAGFTVLLGSRSIVAGQGAAGTLDGDAGPSCWT